MSQTLRIAIALRSTDYLTADTCGDESPNPDMVGDLIDGFPHGDGREG